MPGTDPNLKPQIFLKAVETVDPKSCIGKFSDLWIEFANYYERNDQNIADYDPESEGNLENANIVF